MKEKQLTAFVAGDDEAAKRKVTSLASNIGFSPIDVGGLKAACYLEPMGMMLIGLVFKLDMGRDVGHDLVK